MQMSAKNVAIFGQNVEGKMLQETGIFPSPTPAISQLTATRQALVAATVAAQEGGLVQRQERNALTVQYKGELHQLSLYVSMAAADSAELMERSGYTLTKVRVKPGIPQEVSDLSFDHPGFSGEMNLSWKPVHGALSYTVQYREEGVDYWSANTSTRVKATVSFLEPYKKYIFRVAAVGSAGQGPWSIEVPAFVL